MREDSKVVEEDVRQGEEGNPGKSNSSSVGSDAEGIAENSGAEQAQSQPEDKEAEQTQSQTENDGDAGRLEETQETWSYPKPLYYTVKKGDTLAEISRKMYSTDKYTSRLAQANNLSNADEIYEGQKILIPSIE